MGSAHYTRSGWGSGVQDALIFAHGFFHDKARRRRMVVPYREKQSVRFSALVPRSPLGSTSCILRPAVMGEKGLVINV